MSITKRTRTIRHRETQETEELDLLGSQVGARLQSERAKRRPSKTPQLMGGTSPPQHNQHPLAGSCRTLHCPVKVVAVWGAAVENLSMRASGAYDQRADRMMCSRSLSVRVAK